MYPSFGDWPVHISSYGVFLALAFAAGFAYAVWHARFFARSTDDVVDVTLMLTLSSIAGARVLYILLFPQRFPTILSWFDLRNGGLVFFGGFLGALLGVTLLVWKRSMSVRDWVDLLAPAVATGQCLGRIGCFLNGCCYGRPTEQAWGLVFPGLGDHLPRHPTQLYEAAFHALLVLFLTFLLRRREPPAPAPTGPQPRPFRGLIGGLYLLAYGTFRFMVEFLRDDERGGFFLSRQFSISQVIALGLLIGGVLWLIGCYRMHRQDIPREVPLAESH
jgi:phosphatidylglycerol:prolipoprotein diacylglycerol transferase